MNRELVTEAELRRRLEEELHRHEECLAYRVAGVVRLRGPDSSGCNWSPTVTLRSSGESPRGPCLEIAEDVIESMRKELNLN